MKNILLILFAFILSLSSYSQTNINGNDPRKKETVYGNYIRDDVSASADGKTITVTIICKNNPNVVCYTVDAPNNNMPANYNPNTQNGPLPTPFYGQVKKGNGAIISEGTLFKHNNSPVSGNFTVRQHDLYLNAPAATPTTN